MASLKEVYGSDVSFTTKHHQKTGWGGGYICDRKHCPKCNGENTIMHETESNVDNKIHCYSCQQTFIARKLYSPLYTTYKGIYVSPFIN